uniref:Bis(5'-adenosyl)-triphosphatase n=1 Tax=Ascaris lumbricoides TaxID=6252 RepID=A0A0M3I3Z2_ASCLU
MYVDRFSTSLYLVIFLVNSSMILSLNQNPLLLLISFDGFRYDLLNATLVPNIWQFAQQGVHFISGSRSQYLSYTAPNHVSISTGRLEESHGIVANRFYDPISHEFYDLFNDTGKDGIINVSLSEHFYSGEPIWLSNERAQEGRRSASMFWPAGDAHWPQIPHKPTVVSHGVVIKIAQSGWRISMKSWNFLRVTTIQSISLLESAPLHVDQVLILQRYLAEPDHTLHQNGFYNGELRKKLADLDATFHYALKKIETDEQLASRLNIILTADHGHAEIDGPKNVFCISNYVNITNITMGDNMLYVTDFERQQNIYEKLKKAVNDGNYKINVYLKQDFPERFGYRNSPRVGDIILEPHIGYAILSTCPSELLTAISRNETALHMSTHGMSPDEPEMRAMLVMRGPAFNENLRVRSIANNIDLYPLMCHVLGILEAPNNGSITNMLVALRVAKALPLAMPDVPLKVALFNKLPTILVTVVVPAFLLIIFCLAVYCFADSTERGAIFLSKGYRLLRSRDEGHQTYHLKKSLNLATSHERPVNDTLMSLSSEDEL